MFLPGWFIYEWLTYPVIYTPFVCHRCWWKHFPVFTQEVQNVKWNMKQAGVFSGDASLKVSRGLTSDEAAELRFMNACTPCVRPCLPGRIRLAQADPCFSADSGVWLAVWGWWLASRPSKSPRCKAWMWNTHPSPRTKHRSSSTFIILDLTVFRIWSGHLNSICRFGFSKLGLFPSLAFHKGSLWDVLILVGLNQSNQIKSSSNVISCVSCVATQNTGLRNVTTHEACRCRILEIKTGQWHHIQLGWFALITDPKAHNLVGFTFEHNLFFVQ